MVEGLLLTGPTPSGCRTALSTPGLLKIHKQVGGLFLLMSEAQSLRFVPVCKLVEIYARLRTGLPIKILRAPYVYQFCASLIFCIDH